MLKQLSATNVASVSNFITTYPATNFFLGQLSFRSGGVKLDGQLKAGRFLMIGPSQFINAN